MRLICMGIAVLLAALGLVPLPLSAGQPRTVYLTFDDGPFEATRDILDLLTKEEVPGTFFLIGDHILINPFRKSVYQQLKNSRWAQVANHSQTHAREKYKKFYSDPDGILKDFQQCNEILGFAAPPYPTRLPARIDWRFDKVYVDDTYYPHPSKKETPEGISKLYDHGFVIYGWDVEWKRHGAPRVLDSAESVFAEIVRRFDKGKSVKPDKVVLLMHDYNFKKGEGTGKLKELIQLIKKEGYSFDFINNY